MWNMLHPGNSSSTQLPHGPHPQQFAPGCNSPPTVNSVTCTSQPLVGTFGVLLVVNNLPGALAEACIC
jgi:hypothetical protein